MGAHLRTDGPHTGNTTLTPPDGADILIVSGTHATSTPSATWDGNNLTKAAEGESPNNNSESSIHYIQQPGTSQAELATSGISQYWVLWFKDIQLTGNPVLDTDTDGSNSNDLVNAGPVAAVTPQDVSVFAAHHDTGAGQQWTNVDNGNSYVSGESGAAYEIGSGSRSATFGESGVDGEISAAAAAFAHGGVTGNRAFMMPFISAREKWNEIFGNGRVGQDGLWKPQPGILTA